MNYLRLQDYYSVIRKDPLFEILQSDPFIRATIERATKERIETHLRHRYDLRKAFPLIYEFNTLTSYYVGNLVEYNEPAYNNVRAYLIGDRVSYEVGNYTYIYECIADSTGNLPSDSTFWSQLTEVAIYNVKRDTVGNLPTSAFTLDEGDYLTGFEDLKGWDFNNNLYYRKVNIGNDAEIRFYATIADLSSDLNHVGFLEYTEKPLTLPSPRPVHKGENSTISLAGSITIKDFIPDGESYTITATNYFEKGDNRNPLLVELFKKIAVYELHKTINPRNVPQLRVDDYNDAINTLKSAGEGKITMDLPIYDTQEERGQRFTWGISSNEKYNW